MNYIGHLAFGLEAYKNINKYIKNKDVFLTGCVAPDIAIPNTISKNIGHYRDKSNLFFKAPDLEKFLYKYKSRLDEDFILGYFCHLYADMIFSTIYMIHITKPLDKNKNFYNKKDASFVFLKKQNKLLDASYFKQNNPLYDDYTISNDILVKSFNIPLKINFSLQDPKIDEIDKDKLKNINEEVIKYLKLNNLKNKETSILIIDDYCKFIKLYAKKFSKIYTNLINKNPM